MLLFFPSSVSIIDLLLYKRNRKRFCIYYSFTVEIRKPTSLWCSPASQPLFLFTSGDAIIKLLEMSIKRYLITKRNSQAGCRMVLETRKQSMAWMEHGRLQIPLKLDTHFRSKIKWRLEHVESMNAVKLTDNCTPQMFLSNLNCDRHFPNNNLKLS